MENRISFNRYVQFAIFVIAIPASLSQLAAPVAAQIGEAFGMSVSQVGLITSLPSLAMIFTQLLCSYAVTKVERKVLLVIGLIMAVLGGVGPVFAGSAIMVLCCRVLFGLGVGLINPIPMTYVAEAPQEMRPQLTARWQVVGAIGGAAVMAILGPVSKHGWKAALMLYCIIALFIITSLTAFPTTGPVAKKEAVVSDATAEKKKIPFEYYAGIATAFLMMFVNVGVTSYMSLYIKDAGLEGNELLSGSALMLARLVGGFGTLLVPFFLRKFKGYLGTFASAMIVVAALIYTIPTTFTILVGYAFIYWASMIASVACSTRNTTMIPLHRVAFAQAMLTTILYLGQFLSTIVVNAISSTLNVPVTDKTVIYCLLVPIVVMAIIGLPRKRNQ